MRIIAAAREAENAPLLKQSGAHHVIVSASTAGRLLGLSTSAPPLIDVVEDLLTPGEGMALAMRSAERSEVGRTPRALDALVIALVRRGKVVPVADRRLVVETGDMLVYVGRPSEPSSLRRRLRSGARARDDASRLRLRGRRPAAVSGCSADVARACACGLVR